MGVYVSGHPLDEYMDLWKSSITARTTDFMVDEESGKAILTDGAQLTVGGMITNKVVKTTKTGKMIC